MLKGSLLGRVSRRLLQGIRSAHHGPEEPLPAEIIGSDGLFRVDAPWRLDDRTRIALHLDDSRLPGSNRHFIRFDLYPLIAASHSDRHHGFWDIPLSRFRCVRADVSFHDGCIVVSADGAPVRIDPVWKGSLDFSGYAMLHVSLWDSAQNPPRQLGAVSSLHLLGNALPSLDQVTIPVTQRCNLACPMCMRHNPSDFDESDIPPEVLDPVIDAADRIPSVILTGIGETLLNARLEEIIRRLRRRMPAGGRVGITTNAMLLDRDRAAGIIDAGLTSVCFSIDGASRKTYEAIRPGADFETVVRNVTAAAVYARASGRKDLFLVTNFVMQQENMDEMPEFVRLASSLGVDAVKFSHYRDFSTGEFRMLGEPKLEALFAEVRREADARGIALILPRIRPLAEPRCEFMQMTFLWLTGEIVPCCRMLPGASPRPVRFFGNVQRHGLFDIWESAAYREFRMDVLAGRYPETCTGCNYATGLLC